MADVNMSNQLPYHLLHQGAYFYGTQKLLRSDDPVSVEIQSVDAQNFKLTGRITEAFLRFSTTNGFEMTATFDGEIISQKFPFRTGKWNVTEDIDRAHWEKLGLSNFGDIFKADFDYNALMASNYVFMRWKEINVVYLSACVQFSAITVDGFYYIHLTKSTGIIDGFYFDPDYERFTPLKLEYFSVPA